MNDDGGPAFPLGSLWDPETKAPLPAQTGMTLRDWFAGQALAGLLARFGMADDDEIHIDGICWDAYRFADAMLKERDK